MSRVHRFRATDRAGLFNLAKDLTRLTADAIDAGAIQKVGTPPTGEKWGSLKSLEKLLATVIGPGDAHTMMTPLFGIYELRLADAHLPSSEVDQALEMAGVDEHQASVSQGYMILDSCVGTLYEIAKAFRLPTPDQHEDPSATDPQTPETQRGGSVGAG